MKITNYETMRKEQVREDHNVEALEMLAETTKLPSAFNRGLKQHNYMAEEHYTINHRRSNDLAAGLTGYGVHVRKPTMQEEMYN